MRRECHTKQKNKVLNNLPDGREVATFYLFSLLMEKVDRPTGREDWWTNASPGGADGFTSPKRVCSDVRRPEGYDLRRGSDAVTLE